MQGQILRAISQLFGGKSDSVYDFLPLNSDVRELLKRQSEGQAGEKGIRVSEAWQASIYSDLNKLTGV